MFGQNLKEARKRKNLTLDELANLYNKKFNGSLNKGTLSKYENNIQEPMITTVGNLASILEVSVDFLIGDDDSNGYQNENILPIKIKKFPIIGEIACGQPIHCEQDFETFIEASADISADFCLVAKGDSMINARIFDGDVVFIREQPQVENGEIAAVIINDEATLKRVFYYQNRVELRPENPTFPVLNFENEELHNVRILGKAVAFTSYVK